MAQRVKRYIVGVDVSKDKLDIYEQWSERSYTVGNSAEAIGQWLRGYEVELEIGVEATNRYHQVVSEQAHAQGHTVYVVDPYRLNHYREAVGGRAKVDRLDAGLVARYVSQEGSRVRRWKPLSAGEKRLWELVRRRATLVGSRTQLRQSLSELDVCREEVQALLEQFSRTIRELERAIHRQVRELGWSGWVARCQMLPGVGPLTAVAMVATFQRGPFRSVDAFIAFMGLDVKVRESGKYKGRRKLTKKGDPELRRLLYNAAMSACHHPLWAPFYTSLRARGLSSTAALMALGRKMARVCFALMDKDVEFDPKCCPGG